MVLGWKPSATTATAWLKPITPKWREQACVSDGTSFDVVLLDFLLPDSNDLGLLADIRRPRAGSAQVFMMTACGTPETVQGALDLGAARVVNKPFEVSDLLSFVDAAVGQ